MEMAATLSFRWLDILEKEFDKAFVDLDLLLGEIDPDQCELTYDGRQKMTALSAAFAQLCHKSQTVFQSNAKIEVFDIEYVWVYYFFFNVILKITILSQTTPKCFDIVIPNNTICGIHCPSVVISYLSNE